jgi:hypothetical protein
MANTNFSGPGLIDLRDATKKAVSKAWGDQLAKEMGSKSFFSKYTQSDPLSEAKVNGNWIVSDWNDEVIIKSKITQSPPQDSIPWDF